MIDQNTDRSMTLGGSEIADIMGFGYNTPLRLWLQKSGKAARPDLSDNEKVQWGRELEWNLLNQYEKRFGVMIERDLKFQYPIVYFDKYRLVGNTDGVDYANQCIVEAKVVTLAAQDKWGDEMTNQVPRNYYAQAQTYMLLGGLRRCVFVVVFTAAMHTGYYVVDYDQKFIDEMMPCVANFFKALYLDAPPPAVTLEDVLALWVPTPKVAVDVEVIEEELFQLFQETRATTKHIKLVEESLQAKKKLLLEGILQYDADHIVQGGRKVAYVVRTRGEGKALRFAAQEEKN